MNTKIKMFTAMILWIAVCITVLWFCTSCVKERTDPYYKNLPSVEWVEGDTIGVEYSKLGKVVIRRIPYKDILERMNKLVVIINSQKDTLEILKDQIKMKDLMLEYQKTAIKEMKNELRSRNR